MRGQLIEGKIEGIDSKGRGIFEHAGKRIHTWFAFPGDIVRVRIEGKHKGKWIGKREKLITPSLYRIPARCGHTEITGNCFWQVIQYEQQLALKRGLVQEAFDRHHLEITAPLPLSSPHIFNYRNKMEYAIGKGPVIGFREPKKWWSIIDINGCHLQSEDMFPVLHSLKSYLVDYDILPWNLRSHTGFARYLLVREGKFTGERMVVLITSEGYLPHRRNLIDRLASHATSIYWGVNSTVSDVAISQRLMLLEGKEFLREQIGDFTYFIHPHSFFQPNPYFAEELARATLEFADLKGHERVLDLYCGSGLLSLHLARQSSHVIGVESDPISIALAKKNQEANGVKNAQFVLAKAESLSWVARPKDVVVVDPPRSGLHPKLLDVLINQGPNCLVYISCNYQVLASELTSLLTAYSCETIRLMDFFPHTPHVEVLIKLMRKKTF